MKLIAAATTANVPAVYPYDCWSYFAAASYIILASLLSFSPGFFVCCCLEPHTIMVYEKKGATRGSVAAATTTKKHET